MLTYLVFRMEQTQPYLIPLCVTDESIREQVKINHPRDYRRMRTYVKKVDRSHPRIKEVLPRLEEITRKKFASVRERLYGCDVTNDDVNDEINVRAVSQPIFTKYDDLLELANKNVRKTIPRKKINKVVRKPKVNSFDKASK